MIHLTGTGPFHILALGPHGMKVQPIQGPMEHPRLKYNAPLGDEGGSVFNFPVAGCWDFHATRNNAFWDVWLEVQ